MNTLPDFSPIFDRYLSLRNGIDAVFANVSRDYAALVNCGKGCSDCCHAMFDLSLVEAMFINRKFQESFGFGPERSGILERADESDRKAYKIKRQMFKDSQAGKDNNEILSEAARQRIRCPLLSDDGLCLMYEHRPITCRTYGIPVNIGGKAVSCAKNGFSAGQPYPAISQEALNTKLAELSRDITLLTGGKHSELHEIFVPLSMALLNRYDAQYLGLGGKEPE